MTKKRDSTTIVEVTILAESIFEHFEDVIGGVASDLAYYEMLMEAEHYLLHGLEPKVEEDFKDYLSFTFGFEDKDFKKVMKTATKRAEEMLKVLSGEE